MKSKIILLILTFVFCQSVSAQTGDNHGLILRGTAYDGKVEMHDDYAIWRAKLRMEFVNEGSKPIILINPFTEYGGWKSKIEFVYEYRQSQFRKKKFKDLTFSTLIKQADSRTQKLTDLAEGLNVESPPQNLVHIIQSGNSIQFDDEISIKQKKIRTERNKKYFPDYFSWESGLADNCERSSHCSLPLKTYEYIKIKYQTSLVKYHKKADLLEMLNAKWKTYGVLPIDTNGGLIIVTKPIDNIKYKFIDKTTDKYKIKENKTIQ